MFERPLFLYAILVLIPALLVSVRRFKLLVKEFSSHSDQAKSRQHTTGRFYIRTLFWSCAWICLVIAAAGPYWGEKPIPVQKTGNSISFVFDISYSMLASDMGNNVTRLAGAASYASHLLQYIQGSSVSVVLSKGLGILSVPLTEDFMIIQSLLTKLSPALLSSPGSNLASGIEAAMRSFPPNSANTAAIVLFTDGDETISSLKSAIQQAIHYGISVVIIGFGNTTETEVITGNGEQTAMSALREKKLKEMCTSVKSTLFNRHSITSEENLLYVNALEPASALKVLKALTYFSHRNETGTITLYETKPVPRFTLFIFLAVTFFACGFLVSELRLLHAKKAGLTMFVYFLCPFFFFSCSADTKTAASLLSGVLYWGEKDYQKASAAFLEAEDSAKTADKREGAQYASFALASTYLMQNETEAALNRLVQLEEGTPVLIQFGSLYNSGIIYYQSGDYKKAADYFKRALLVDSKDLNAKINLELTMNQIAVQASASQQEMIPFQDSKTSAAQENIFSVIRENDSNQWKNQKQEESDILDY